VGERLVVGPLPHGAGILRLRPKQQLSHSKDGHSQLLRGNTVAELPEGTSREADTGKC
jgi:hypothetical protein